MGRILFLGFLFLAASAKAESVNKESSLQRAKLISACVLLLPGKGTQEFVMEASEDASKVLASPTRDMGWGNNAVTISKAAGKLAPETLSKTQWALSLIGNTFKVLFVGSCEKAVSDELDKKLSHEQRLKKYKEEFKAAHADLESKMSDGYLRKFLSFILDISETTSNQASSILEFLKNNPKETPKKANAIKGKDDVANISSDKGESNKTENNEVSPAE